MVLESIPDWLRPGIVLVLAFNCLVFTVIAIALAVHRYKTVTLSKTLHSKVDTQGRNLRHELEAVRTETGRQFSEVAQRIARLELRSLSRPYVREQHFSRLEKKHQVVALAERGFGIDVISKKLKLYPGETQLFLGLCKYFRDSERRNERTLVH